MGNKVIQKSSFNIIEISELKEFLESVNVLDGFFVDTNLAISSKCLVIINNLINHLSLSSNMGDDLYNYKSCDIFPGVSIPFDRESFDKIEKFKFNCQLIRHLSICNSNVNVVEEFIELNNFHDLISLQLENVPIKFVQHLKLHRTKLLKLSVHNCISDLESLIELCGGDQSFSGNWSNLIHLDLRYNNLRSVDKSVLLLSQLTVLDVSRNNIQSLAFVEKIPTLACLNASYNYIDALPKIPNHCLRVLIIGYNHLNSLEEIRNFKLLSTLNASYNMISSVHYLHQLNELDYLKDLILVGNPIYASANYRISVLSVVSTRVIINFALDGRVFSKRERTYLRKIPVIVIEPPSHSNSQFNDRVPIIKPKPRELDIGEGIATSPDTGAGSYIRNQNRIAKIKDRDCADDRDSFESIDKVTNINIEKEIAEPTKVHVIREEFIIDTPEDTEYDGTMTTVEEIVSDQMSPSRLQPFYIGEKTSNLVCVSHKNRISFTEVSLQIIENKLMAVDEQCVIVDNLNLWTLLVANNDLESNSILRLTFYDESSPLESKQLLLLNRSLEFAKPEDLMMFFGHLDVYLKDFSISLENVSNIVNTNVLMVCCRCLSNYEFHKRTLRPIICNDCNGVEFKFENPFNLTKPQVKTGWHSPFTGVSPQKTKAYVKPETSVLVLKAFSADNISNCGQSESGVSHGTSYCTAYGDQTYQESVKSDLESIGGSQDYSSQDDKTYGNVYKDTLNLDLPIDYQNNKQLLENPESIIPKIPDQDPSIIYLNKIRRSNWVCNEPLSNICIYMDNVTKIDDRVKLYFLTKIMRDNEDMHAAFKSTLLYKPMSSLTTEAFVVISNFRILFYSWADKDSPSLEDCLKLIVEFPLKHLLQIDDCLNHQWIDILFKKKCRVLLFIGDMGATKDIMQSLIEICGTCVLKMVVRTLKEIDKLKSNDIKIDMAKVMTDNSNIGALNICEYYLVKHWSGFNPNEALLSENAPKMISIHSEYLFFINIKFHNKPYHIQFDLIFTLSIYDLKAKITVDSVNHHRCRIETSENNPIKSIDIEFFSPSTRSQVLLAIEKLWKDLFQTNFTFELTPLDRDS